MRLLYLFLILGLISIISACGGMKSKETILSNTNSKPEQTKMESYEDLWKKVADKEKDGLPKSALEMVDSIFIMAKSDSNSLQQIKALLHKAKYTGELDEDGVKSGIKLIAQEGLSLSDPIALAISHSLLGELYYNYYMMNVWEINQRTPIQGDPDPDIDTWSSRDFLKKSRYHYEQSLIESALKKARVADYSILLTDEKNTDLLRPTLYDILGHRAIDHFINTGSDIDESDESLIMDNPKLFGHTTDFLTVEIKDEISSKQKVINLFKDLEKFNLENNNPKAWIDVVQKRLQYAFDHFTGAEKDYEYEKGLTAWITKTNSEKLAAPFQLLLANLYMQNGSPDLQQGDDTLHKNKLKKALKLYEQIVKENTNTNEAKQAANQIHNLKTPYLHAQVEQVNLVNKPFRILLTYKNISSIFIKAVAIPDDLRDDIFGQSIEKYYPAIANLQTKFLSSSSLPSNDDLIQHHVELKIDPLPSGMYAILLSDDEGFALGKGSLALMYTHVSNLAYLHSYHSNYFAGGRSTAKNIVVMDRYSGSPVAETTVSIYERKYKPSTQTYINELVTKTSSDKTGKVASLLPASRTFSVKLEKGNDVLWLDDAFSNNSYEVPKAHATEDILFFLDRSIYRPSQTVYFKALVILREPDGKVSIMKNKKVDVKFVDANGQEKASKVFTSNEYGSFNGSFMTPAGGLLGSMSLQANQGNSSVSLQVEEYKRPKFEVIFDTSKIIARLNEIKTISGIARNFSGNVVDQARVKYKVTRTRWQRPLPWWKWWGFIPYEQPQIIEQGVTETDAFGKFVIPFNAKVKPGTDLNKEEVSYTFSIEVDVTDFTGETRSNTFTTRIGNKNLVLKSTLVETEDRDSLKEFIISATDLNDIKISANGHVELHKLVQDKNMYRKRFWPQPDQYIIPESDYKNWFPTDVYKDEDKIILWKTEKIILNTGFKSENPIKLNELPDPGIYKLIAKAKDAYNQETIYETYFWVNDAKNKVYPKNEPLLSIQNASKLQPGQELTYSIITKVNPQYVIQNSTFSNDFKWIVSDGSVSDKTKLDEKDRGKLHQIQWIMVRDNRVYSSSIAFGIDWSNKDLNIQTISYRDKLQPGQNESWSFKISGNSKDKFVAELVAAMYDQSLDALYPHEWRRNLYSEQWMPIIQYTPIGFNSSQAVYVKYSDNAGYQELEPKLYRNLNWFGFNLYGGRGIPRGGIMYKSRNAMPQAATMEDAMAAPPPQPTGQAGKNSVDKQVETSSADLQNTDQNSKSPSVVVPRRNLNETVFFYPDIKSDEAGNFIIKFKMNEALTRWRLMVFGHTQDLQSGYLEKEILTQKELMVFPNGPRFLRQNDKMVFPAKVSNLSDKTISGTARLELFDPITEKMVNKEFELINDKINFTVSVGQSAPLAWNITVPEGYAGLLGYRVIAESGAHADAEENAIPILTNRMLVTETMPFTIRAKQTKSLKFEELVAKSGSGTLKNHQLSLEISSNPVWYAIQALPYLMEFPHECTEQMVNRFFANSLAEKIVQSNPRIKNVFDAWAKNDMLKSPLQKNEELKTAVLAETPWVRDALNEAEQQKLIAVLFDINKMSSEKEKVLNQIRARQLSNGGFPWFEGRDDWYITQYIIEDLGHLKKLGVLGSELDDVIQNAVFYCDRELVKFYEESKRLMKKEDIGLPDIAQHYLYARSFFTQWPIDNDEAFKYFLGKAESEWLKQGLYNQGLLALGIHRWKAGSPIPKKILVSLDERAQHKEELGMYWKFEHGYRYFELPVETQAILIEAYADILNDKSKIDEMRLWLLKNKQTNKWSSTKATSAAIFALLVNGETSWINETKLPEIRWGTKLETPDAAAVTPGLGYFKIKKQSDEIKPELASFTVKNENNHILWGGIYWQYFEDLNKITSFKTMPIAIHKKMYIETTEGNKRELKSVTDYKVGDKLIVRIELKVDRPMDYLHLKDMRAAGLEPVNVISQYKYQGSLGYYESTKDIATHFFIDHISAGTFVLEYPLRVTQKGLYSNGISTLQCMYAPEFTAHSSGETVSIK